MKKINLLILDDKEENIISLKALLGDIENINIISTTEPNEALKLCWKNDISIALVDVQMPDINGFEFVSLLKANPKTSHIIAIMVTAISKEDKYLIKGLQSGAVDYLYKPLNPEITIAKVNAFVKQVQIQEEIIQKNNELELSKIALIQANKEAENARKSKEIFLANMSHEIRTPINGIMGIIHMLKSSNLNDEQRDWVKYLSTASSSLLMIINDILDISKIDSGMMKIEFENFYLKDLIEETANIFRMKAENKKLQLNLCLSDRLPKIVHFDSLRLQQILSNFISNSLKFTDTGTVEFIVDVLATHENSHKIRFAVKDTGIGIKAEAVEKIFQEFEQGDDRITKKFGGTGLGLAIVKRLAKLLNGEVLAESNYGEGSTFSFIVDIKEVVEESISKKEELVYTQLTPLSQLKVLIAEDNDLNSFMLAHMLRTWKCDVTIVKNGHLALEAMNTNKFDLILMDTHMPVMSGFEAITTIRNNQDPHKNRIPIITISASVMEHEQKAAFEVGADDVIGKPFNPIELYNKIVKVCQLDVINS
ncbi:response regulator [Sphingobacterium composti Ten et al. 2007 non Yoo et al. 2007]|uniref:response regulator n=1 Tax=Sphingobacterium composti TaxID=363260 RepID=UPI0013589DF9|nr:response regulator [Sphingobacterium composti Ten et al. 2007 non Yoo et al. 2007]